MSAILVDLPDLEATERLGAALAQQVRAGDLLFLEGELGAGKTTLARAIGEGLHADPPLSSPTFVLVSEHSGRLPIWHLDAYRLDPGSDPLALGLVDLRNEVGVTIVEWAKHLAWSDESATMQIDLESHGSGRRATIRCEAPGRLDEIATAALATGLRAGVA